MIAPSDKTPLKKQTVIIHKGSIPAQTQDSIVSVTSQSYKAPLKKQTQDSIN